MKYYIMYFNALKFEYNFISTLEIKLTLTLSLIFSIFFLSLLFPTYFYKGLNKLERLN